MMMMMRRRRMMMRMRIRMRMIGMMMIGAYQDRLSGLERGP